MLDNCKVWLNLAMGLVHPTIDMKIKGNACTHTHAHVCTHTCFKKRQKQLQKQKGSAFKISIGTKKLFFCLSAKWKGTKDVSTCQLVWRFLYLDCSTVAIYYNNLHECIIIHSSCNEIKFGIMDEMIKIQLLLLAYVFSI